MKIRKIILIISLLLIFPINVYAKTCSKEERNKVYAMINNIKINYVHSHDNYFNISISNVPEELYLVLPSGRKIYSNNLDDAKKDTYPGGKKITFNVYSTNGDECIDEMKYVKTLFIRSYNVYSEKEICKNEDYKDFKYCNKNYQGDITEEKFEKELKKYEKNLTIPEEVPKVEEKENNNYIPYIIYGTIGATLILVITIIAIFRKRSRRKIKL